MSDTMFYPLIPYSINENWPLSILKSMLVSVRGSIMRSEDK
jgi:hypothetical protein